MKGRRPSIGLAAFLMIENVAVELGVRIMNAFVETRRFLASNAALFEC